MAIGREIGFSAEQLTELEWGGLLHDIGKMGIPEQILRKPASLDLDEMDVMRRHPMIGGDMTHGVAFLERIRPMIRNHHERMDGSGYPDGLRGEQISIGARIVAAADTYDALTSDRPYQPGRPTDQAMVIMNRLAGTTLDKGVVEALSRALGEVAVEGNPEPTAVDAVMQPPITSDEE